jgi:hypothetical protein
MWFRVGGVWTACALSSTYIHTYCYTRTYVHTYLYAHTYVYICTYTHCTYTNVYVHVFPKPNVRLKLKCACRNARSTTTLSWADGSLGRAFVTVSTKAFQSLLTHLRERRYLCTYVIVCVCMRMCVHMHTHTLVMYICIYNVCMYVCKHTRSCKHAA